MMGIMISVKERQRSSLQTVYYQLKNGMKLNGKDVEVVEEYVHLGIQSQDHSCYL